MSISERRKQRDADRAFRDYLEGIDGGEINRPERPPAIIPSTFTPTMPTLPKTPTKWDGEGDDNDVPMTEAERMAAMSPEIQNKLAKEKTGNVLTDEQSKSLSEKITKTPNMGWRKFGLFLGQAIEGVGNTIAGKSTDTGRWINEVENLNRIGTERNPESSLSRRYQENIVGMLSDKLSPDQKDKITKMSYEDLTKIFPKLGGGNEKPVSDYQVMQSTWKLNDEFQQNPQVQVFEALNSSLISMMPYLSSGYDVANMSAADDRMLAANVQAIQDAGRASSFMQGEAESYNDFNSTWDSIKNSVKSTVDAKDNLSPKVRTNLLKIFRDGYMLAQKANNKMLDAWRESANYMHANPAILDKYRSDNQIKNIYEFDEMTAKDISKIKDEEIKLFSKSELDAYIARREKLGIK